MSWLFINYGERGRINELIYNGLTGELKDDLLGVTMDYPLTDKPTPEPTRRPPRPINLARTNIQARYLQTR